MKLLLRAIAVLVAMVIIRSIWDITDGEGMILTFMLWWKLEEIFE